MRSALPQGDRVEVLFDPQKVPFRGMRSAQHPSMLAPGEDQLRQNIRSDSGAAKVRNGTTLLTSANTPFAGAVFRGSDSVLVNGSQFNLSAWSDGATIQIWKYVVGTNTWTELTGTNQFYGPAGNNRFPTITRPDGSAAFCTFTVVRAPRGSNNKFSLDFPTRVNPTDMVLIGNGEDDWRLWNPTEDSPTGVAVHQPLTVPLSAATRLRQTATAHDFWTVGGTGGTHVYFASAGPPKVNDANFKMFDSTTAPYIAGASTQVISFSAANAGQVATNIATVRFTAGSKTGTGGMYLGGEQFWMFTDGLGVPAALAQLKIELSFDNLAYGSQTWVTLYDPLGTSDINGYQSIALDTTATPRTAYVFSCAHMQAARVYGIRFTWQGAATGAAIAFFIIGMAAGGVFPVGSQFAISYEDQQGRNEGYGIEASTNNTDKLSNIGGPSFLNLSLPVDGRFKCDYRLTGRNSDTISPIIGGLNGEPNVANVYYRPVAGVEAFWIGNIALWKTASPAGVNQWQTNSTWTRPNFVVNLSDIIVGAIPGTLRISPIGSVDPSRPLPSSYNQGIPIAMCEAVANQRLHVGNVKVGGVYSRGDEWFSTLKIPFRFQEVLEDDLRGSKNAYDGEVVQAIVTAAASVQGASSIYVLTSASLHMLGGAGATTGASMFTASALGTSTRYGGHGTLMPGSVQEHLGRVFWIDQEGQPCRLIPQGAYGMATGAQGSGIQTIGRLMVDDQFKGVPGSRRGFVTSMFWKDRWYIAYTPSGGSLNTQILIWNDILGEWESNDKVPGVDAAALVRWFDSSTIGSGQRCLLYTSANSVYGFEEGTADPSSSGVAARITTRELSKGPDLAYSNKEVYIVSDATTGVMTITRFYRPYGSQYTSTIDFGAANAFGWMTDGSKPHTETVAPGDAGGERGFGVYYDFLATLTGGKSIFTIMAVNSEPHSHEAVVG